MTGKKFIPASWLKALVGALLLVTPQLAFAQLLISEIQYNPEGTDGGYEWIELYNDSDQALSIQSFTFRESEQNHRLVQTNEGLGWHIPANGYAVIADNPTKFLEKHPGFPGLLFDSSFSLLNTGELLEILDADGELLFGFEYNPIWGGDGDGSTLGIISGSWIATNPTPGYINGVFASQDTEEESTDTETDTTEEAEDLTQDPVSDLPQALITLADPEYQEKTIKADAGGDRILMAGVPFELTGSAYGLAGGILKEAHFTWNFGDGTRDKGSTVIHTYPNPGTYVGSLRVRSGNYSHTDQFEVQVITPELLVQASTTDQTVSLQNHSNHTLEISGFKIVTAGTTFIFPSGSFIKGRSQITLPAASLDITVRDQARIHLQSPDGNALDSFLGLEEQIKDQITLLEQEVGVIEQSSITKQDKAELETEEQLEQQIVYIGVPQYIEPAVDTEYVPTPAETLTQVGQAASLPAVVKKEFLSPFEMLLIVLLVIASGIFGYMQFKKREKYPQIEIEEF